MWDALKILDAADIDNPEASSGMYVLHLSWCLDAADIDIPEVSIECFFFVYRIMLAGFYMFDDL